LFLHIIKKIKNPAKKYGKNLWQKFMAKKPENPWNRFFG
jgi:hypothetical protein